MTNWSGYAYNTVPQRIALEQDDDANVYEHVAAAALSPGHVLKRNSSNQVLKHATLGSRAERLVALEDVFRGLTINDAYASTDLVACTRPEPNDVLLLRVAAAAAAIVVGDQLTVAADGTVKKRTITADTYTDAGAGASTFAQEQTIFAIAENAVDNSAGGSEAFVIARIM